MRGVAIFFCKQVSDVQFSINVFDCNKLGEYGFSNSVLSYLNITETFGGHVFGPLYTCCVIIVYCGGGREENRRDLNIVAQVTQEQ